MNSIMLDSVYAKNNMVVYNYTVKGEWSTYFLEKESIQVEYSEDISSVPKSILSIPFVGSIMPLVWLKNASLYLDELDKDYYLCLDRVKQGYIDMIPELEFRGDIIVKNVVENSSHHSSVGAPIVMFSGGVDAFTTLFRHLDEAPILLTIWGADMPLKDVEGWKNVYKLTQDVASSYSLKYTYVKSPFREFLDEEKLNEIVKVIHDGFWHAVQHSLGLLSHVAPYAFIRGADTVYIASSYPQYMIEDQRIICASDPRTDNYVKFCGIHVVHDGTEYDRQGKVHYLVNTANRGGKKINLRVCFLNNMGVNCCRCEKCYRTILQLVSEGEDPNNFGFVWNEDAIKRCEKDMKYTLQAGKTTIAQSYPVIQQTMRQNKDVIKNYDMYAWLEKMDFSKFNDYPIKRFKKTIIYRGARKIVRKIVGGGNRN